MALVSVLVMIMIVWMMVIWYGTVRIWVDMVMMMEDGTLMGQLLRTLPSKK